MILDVRSPSTALTDEDSTDRNITLHPGQASVFHMHLRWQVRDNPAPV